MENSMKALILAASISITCMVISLGFYAARQASSISSITTEKLNKIGVSLEEDEYLRYDGLELMGSDVVNCIQKNLSSYSSTDQAPIYIYVDTGLTTNKYDNNAGLNQIKDFTSNYYIHPLKKFKGQVKRNENDVITGVLFLAV